MTMKRPDPLVCLAVAWAAAGVLAGEHNAAGLDQAIKSRVQMAASGLCAACLMMPVLATRRRPPLHSARQDLVLAGQFLQAEENPLQFSPSTDSSVCSADLGREGCSGPLLYCSSISVSPSTALGF